MTTIQAPETPTGAARPNHALACPSWCENGDDHEFEPTDAGTWLYSHGAGLGETFLDATRPDMFCGPVPISVVISATSLLILAADDDGLGIVEKPRPYAQVALLEGLEDAELTGADLATLGQLFTSAAEKFQAIESEVQA